MTSKRYCYFVRMDVQHDKEALFNEVYDTEHLPELSRLPGVSRICRYRTAVPHEPRYMVIYEIEHPDIPVSPGWKSAADKGRWAPEVRPYTMNRERHRAVCTRIGGSQELLCSTPYLFLEALDVEPHRSDLLNHLYESERLPALVEVTGVRNIVRYSAQEDGHPAYLTVFEIDAADVPTSAAFAGAEAQGRWTSEVLPYTYNRHLVLYERIGL
jgi:hypothetical protein